MTLSFGLELECLIHRDLTSGATGVNIGCYHEGLKTTEHWKAENDGSVCPSMGDRLFIPVEFVSSRFASKSWSLILNELKQRIQPQGNSLELLKINNSCGAHIHFSVNKNRKNNSFYLKIPIRYLIKIRELCFQRVNEQLPHLYVNFRNQYFRRMAQQINERNVGNDRYLEFNFTSRYGIEWRSFNLEGCRSWSDIEKLVTIGLGCISEVIYSELEKEKSFSIETKEVSVEINDSEPKLDKREIKKVITIGAENSEDFDFFLPFERDSNFDKPNIKIEKARKISEIKLKFENKLKTEDFRKRQKISELKTKVR